MAAYRNNKNGHKVWLIQNSHGGWLLQYRPNKTDVEAMTGESIRDTKAKYPNLDDEDTHVYAIKIIEVERKKLFTVKASQLMKNDMSMFSVNRINWMENE